MIPDAGNTDPVDNPGPGGGVEEGMILNRIVVVPVRIEVEA